MNIKKSFRFKLGIYMTSMAVAIVILLGGLQYYSQYKVMSRNDTESRALLEKTAIESMRYIDTFFRLYNKTIETKMKDAARQVNKIYEVTGSIKGIDLEEIKKKYGVDLFIISKDKRVLDATYKPDIGLDFSKYNEFSIFLDRVFKNGVFILDGISLTVIDQKQKIFSYCPTSDKRYIVETGFNIEDNQIIHKNTLNTELDKIRHSSNSIESINILLTNGSSLNKTQQGKYYSVKSSNKSIMNTVFATGKKQSITVKEGIHKYKYSFIPFVLNSGARDARNVVLEIKFNSDKFEDALAANRSISLWMILFSILLSIVISFFASRVISRPLAVMFSSIKEIASGNLTHVAKINTKDEFYLLSNSFNHMVDTITGLLDKLHDNYLNTVRALANAIEANDTYTKGHCERVTKISIEIAKAMKLTEGEIINLEFAGLLHDIGKIGIPESVINKNGKLTDEEFELIKKHPEIGYKILEETEFLERSRVILRQHHERPDGSGYPLGLFGHELLIESKILSVADSFDAMTSARPYRKSPLTTEEASKELVKYKGVQFDTEVVETFLKLLESKEITF